MNHVTELVKSDKWPMSQWPPVVVVVVVIMVEFWAVFQVKWTRRGLLKLISGQYPTTQHAATTLYVNHTDSSCVYWCVQHLWWCRRLHPFNEHIFQTTQRQRETPRERQRWWQQEPQAHTQLLWEATRGWTPGHTHTNTHGNMHASLIFMSEPISLSLSVSDGLQAMEVDTGK